MNLRIVLKILALMSATVGVAFGVCWGVGQMYGEAAWDESDWLRCVGICLAVAAVLYIMGRRADSQFFKREAFGTIGLGWLLCCALGALPYCWVGDLPWQDAFFESTSGFTTTGASVIADVEALPHSLLFWRSLSQWIGGLGIVIFFAAILVNLGAGAKLLYTHESSGDSRDLAAAQARDGIFQLIVLYVGVSTLCFLSMWWIAGIGGFDALCHTMATVSTGGFSTLNGGMGQFNSAELEWVTIVFMSLCGVSFILGLRIVGQRSMRALKKDSEFRFYVAGLIFASVGVAWILGEHYSQGESAVWRSSIFQVSSILTSTGFASRNYAEWPAATQVILFVVMVMGGCAGSTAGGLKVVRVMSVLKLAMIHLELSFRSHILRPLRINGQRVSELFIERLLRYIVLAMLVYGVCLVIFSVNEPDLSFQGSWSGVMACLANTGPGQAELGPTHTYASISAGSKVLLSVTMLIGRLEFYAVLVLFFPSLWRRLS